MKHLKITASLFLLVHAFHLASLQNSTDSPGRTIDKSWLRDRAKNAAETPNAAVPAEETVNDQMADSMESDSSGIPSGFMLSDSGDETNVITNKTSGVNESPTFENATNKQLDATVAPNTTADPADSNHVNMTKPKEESNSTLTPQNTTTSFPDVFFNRTDLPSTTLAPETNTTQVPTTAPGEDVELTNSTESTNTTTTAAPEINQTSSMTSSTAVLPPETTKMTTAATSTPEAPITAERANRTDKDASSGGSSDRGLASDSQRRRRQGAWGAVLGTAVAVACVGLVAYIIMKKKYQKGFSHRKLVEEYPSEPVLRLDNCHLDLNFGGGSAYYNPALQGDNIQMSNIPGRR
ncbi:mucin-15 [Parambassis ranga]|uniref:Mucin-15 n=1 Tax=Parambassis ranga TaxID=210632 RepID=A0A6P7I6C8_9TELE|nr:mucin-15 [Parambassis ranga]